MGTVKAACMHPQVGAGGIYLFLGGLLHLLHGGMRLYRSPVEVCAVYINARVSEGQVAHQRLSVLGDERHWWGLLSRAY